MNAYFIESAPCASSRTSFRVESRCYVRATRISGGVPVNIIANACSVADSRMVYIQTLAQRRISARKHEPHPHFSHCIRATRQYIAQRQFCHPPFPLHFLIRFDCRVMAYSKTLLIALLGFAAVSQVVRAVRCCLLPCLGQTCTRPDWPREAHVRCGAHARCSAIDRVHRPFLWCVCSNLRARPRGRA